MADGTRWGLSWHERPAEEAAHFNPAFCGELLTRTIQDYRRLRGSLLPLPLSFLVLPLTLHPGTRSALPRKANTTFVSWSAENEDILTAVPDRVLRLRPVTREALLFLLQLDAISIGMDGLGMGAKPLRSATKGLVTTNEVDEMRRTAGLLGRWFAYQAAPAAILQTMGVRV
jgi:hypothetical protein